MALNQNRQLISLDTPLEKDTLILTHVEGEEQLSHLFSFTLQSFSEVLDIDEKKILGKTITCTLQDNDQSPRYLHGYVKQFIKEDLKFKKIREYTLEVVPWLWFLTLSQDCQIFQNKTVIEICEAIFKQFNFSNFKFSLTQSYPKREYCVQYNESALNFVSRLWEEEGIFYYFQHEQDKHILVLSDLSKNCSYNPDKEIPYAQGSLIKNHFTSLKHSFHFCSGEFTQTDYDPLKPTLNLLTTTKTSLTFDNIKNYKVFQFPGLYDEKDQGDKLSRIRIEQHEQTHDRVNGEGSSYHFTPGTKFTLKKGEIFPEQGDFLIVSVNHKAHDATHSLYRGLIQLDQEVQSYSNTFTAIPLSVPYRPLPVIPKPKVFGLQIAKVTGPSQEEIYTDQYGRVKVQFFWDRQGQNNETSSCWLRVAQRWAGPQWGAIYLPRVGHEVLVDFLEGNPDRPIIVGSLYNAQNKPPYELPAHKTQSGVKSHSTPQGETSNSNEIRFEDQKDQEQFFVHAQKDFLKVVENNDQTQIKGGQELSVQKDRKKIIEEGNETLEIKKGNQTLTLGMGNQILKIAQGNRQTTINMGQDSLHLQQGNYSIKLDLGKVTVEALQGIELKVGQSLLKLDQTGITLEGLMVKINGKMVQFNADALLQLKGALVMIN